MSRTNYIFVDFENVQETDLGRIANKPVKVTLVLGERHKSLPLPLVKLIHKFPEQVRLIETQLNGKNALDFVLACEVGIESEKDPTGYFHVLSRDKGFDALIDHLRGKDILAARHIAFSEIPVLMNVVERVRLLMSHYQMSQTNRPKKQKKLESQIHAFFGKILSPKEIEETIRGLVVGKAMTITEKGEIAYKLIAAPRS